MAELESALLFGETIHFKIKMGANTSGSVWVGFISGRTTMNSKFMSRLLHTKLYGLSRFCMVFENGVIVKIY